MMNKTYLRMYPLTGIAIATLVIISCSSKNNLDNLKFIDPQIGGVAPFLQPTRPRMHVPNSMVRVYPQRNDYRDDQIRSFPLIMREHRSDPLFSFLPVSGNIPTNEIPVSAWDQELETATPYYFSTWLEDFDITVEFSPSERSGFYRFTFNNSDVRKLFLLKTSGQNWSISDDGFITATESFEGMTTFTYACFDAKGTLETNGDHSWLTFTEPNKKKINLKYGISFISPEQAKKNLENEIPDWEFEKVKNTAREKWSKVVNRIQVEGGTEAYKRTFYTALYRCYERMINITEDGRYYSNYDKNVHNGERDFYVDDWIWDTFLALHPLRFILNPDLEADMIASYIRMYEQSGWLPQFPQVYGDTPPMNGFHSTIMILDAWRKGIRD